MITFPLFAGSLRAAGDVDATELTATVLASLANAGFVLGAAWMLPKRERVRAIPARRRG